MKTQFGTLDRRRAVETLLADRGDLLVVTGLGSPSYDVFAAGDHDANFYLWGAMGGAAIVGLGLALARKDRPVVVVTGDGEQLMGLGGLVTIGVKQPGNLTILVLDNGHYGETGMQLSHSGMGVDIHQVARAAGIADCIEITDQDGLEAFRPSLHATSGGTRLAVVRIASGNVERALPSRDGVHIKNRFRTHLGMPVA